MELFPNGVGRRRLGVHWMDAKDGDSGARELFSRHYSRRKTNETKLFVGPGEKCVLITEDGRALFVWRKFKDDSGQEGVNCAIFRNEGDIRSSDLVVDAVAIAAARWPGERLYTYVDPRAIRSTNPGYCFIAAGWRKCGVTKKRRLLILCREGYRISARASVRPRLTPSRG